MKNGDIPSVQKLVAKIKASKSSEYLGAEPWAPSVPPGTTARPGACILATGSVLSKLGCKCWL